MLSGHTISILMISAKLYTMPYGTLVQVNESYYLGDYLRYDGDPWPKPAQPQLGDVDSVNRDRTARSFNNPFGHELGQASHAGRHNLFWYICSAVSSTLTMHSTVIESLWFDLTFFFYMRRI